MEKRMKQMAEIIKYAEQYKSTLPYYSAYKKAKQRDTYFRKHESEILLFSGAKRMLEQAGIDLKSLNLKKLKSEYQKLEKKKMELSATYKTCEKESNQIRRQLEELQKYLGLNQSSEIHKTKKQMHSL